jgi:hypothetical protein
MHIFMRYTCMYVKSVYIYIYGYIHIHVHVYECANTDLLGPHFAFFHNSVLYLNHSYSIGPLTYYNSSLPLR